MKMKHWQSTVLVFALLLAVLLTLSACQDPKLLPTEQTSSSIHASSTLSGSSSTNPNLSGSSSTNPNLNNCENGHTFLEDSDVCDVCGINYYSATLLFELAPGGQHYILTGLGSCTRTKVIVPAIYNGLPVSEIGSRLYENTEVHEWVGDGAVLPVTQVVLPETIQKIAHHAFGWFVSLEQINIPEGITEIENGVFGRCCELKEIIIPRNVTSIGGYAFAYCRSLTEITIPEGVTYIGEAAFRGCSKLTRLEMPDNVTEIGNSIVQDCTSLEYLRISDCITVLPERMAHGCSSLKAVSYNYDEVTAILGSAFFGCTNLQRIDLGNKLTTISAAAFYGCRELKEVMIPDSVTEVGGLAFSKCNNLETVVIGKGVISYGKRPFAHCDKLKAVYYLGTEEEWAQSRIEEETPGVIDPDKEPNWLPNPQFTNITNFFYSEEEPTQPGNYWRYVDGKPTPWETAE